MPPKKKQPKPNAFICFAQEWKSLQEAKGIKFPGGMKEVVEKASEPWNELKPAVRAHFEAVAKQLKQENNIPAKKFTTFGESLEDVQRRLDEQVREKNRELNDIENLVKAAALDQCNLVEECFFLMDVNYYCVANDMYIVNELTIMAFNLKDGIKAPYHTIVNPGSIPMGFAADAKESFPEHNFSLPPLDDGEGDYQMILAAICEYIQTFSSSGHSRPPPIFTKAIKVPAVTSFIDQICAMSCQDPAQYRVYQMHEFLYQLLKVVTPGDQGLKHSLCEDVFDKNNFEYTPRLGCNFHEATDVYHKCTKSRVKQWAYLIMDHCCAPLLITPIPGMHLPEGIDVEAVAEYKRSKHEEERKDRPFTFVDHAASEAGSARDGGHQSAPPTSVWGGVSTPGSEGGSAWPSLARGPGSIKRPPTSVSMAAPHIVYNADDEFPALQAGRGRGRKPQVETRLGEMKLQ